MRSPNEERLRTGLITQFFASSCGGTKHTIDYGSLLLRCERHGFEYRCMSSCSKEEKLVQAQPQNVAHGDIDAGSAKAINPEIEQGDIAQDTVKQFKRERAIRTHEVRLAKPLRNNRIGKAFFLSPCAQRP